MKIHASTGSLADVREFVSVNARNHSFSEKQINDIRLAVDEACTNVIKHAYNYDEKGQLLIQLSLDRKSTRLNSSHVAISYAVFCLKKKNLTNKDSE